MPVEWTFPRNVAEAYQPGQVALAINFQGFQVGAQVQCSATAAGQIDFDQPNAILVEQTPTQLT